MLIIDFVVLDLVVCWSAIFWLLGVGCQFCGCWSAILWSLVCDFWLMVVNYVVVGW